MKRNYLALVVVILFVVLSSHISYLFASESVTPNEVTTKIQSLPKGVSIHQLDNGMKVLLIENSALPMVGVNVVVKVGSAYETFATSGMSHFLEHLLFNGTTSRTQKQLYDDVDRIGGYNNANTSEFFTNYMMVTPAEHIRKGMEIQADMLFNSTLPPEKYDKEKGIVLEEISKSLINPREQLERNTISILYAGHALSLSTLGTYSTIESMSCDDVYNFYKNNYVPNNMILSVIGNFRTDKMLALINDIYGVAGPGKVKREVSPEWSIGFQPLPVKQHINMVYHRFYDGGDIKLQMLYKIPQFQSTEFFELLSIVLEKNVDEIQTLLKSEFPQSVKSVILSARPSPIVNYVEVAISLKQEADFSAMVQSVSTKLTKLNFVLPEQTVKSEVSKARTSFLKNIEKPHMFGIYNANEFVINGIEAVLSSYSGNEYYNAAEQLKTIKLTSHPIIIIQYPSIKKDHEKVEASIETKLFKDKTTLIAVQNDASNLLAVHYLVKHKAMYESKYGKDAAKILHDCLGQRLDSDENQKISSRFGLTYVVNDNPYIPMDNIYLHPDFGYIRVEGLADDLSGAIDYLNNQLKDFMPTEEEFNKAVGKFKGPVPMMMGGKKAKKLFDETYKSLIYEPDKYPKGPADLTFDNLMAFTKEYFQPANMIISAVSPASPDSIKNLFVAFTGDQIIDEPAAYSKTLQMQNKDVNIEKDGGGERSFLFWGFTRKIDPADKPALKALSLVLSDIIIFDVREKQGMAYQMSAGIDPIQDKALFYIRMGTRPQNVDILLPQYPEFFKMKTLDSITEKDIEKSINMYLGRMMLRRLSSINQAYYLAHSLYFHGDIDYDKQFLEKLKNVKLSDVKQAAKKYMKIKNPVTVVVR